MKTELFSVSKIFTERLLRVPDYQRGYAWTSKQLKDFWSDLLQLDRAHNHYFGVLTLESVKEEQYSRWSDDLWIIKSKNYEPFYIVDGQQRITTTIVLLQSILERIGDRSLNYTTPSEIKKKFIFESKDSGISRSYLFGYEVDNPSYEFLKQQIFCEKSDLQSSPQETIYTNNLMEAKRFFEEKLKEINIEEIETIYTKITQNMLFNIYQMSDEIDVHVSFETMNNRGKPLSHLELLKNRLIYLSTKITAEEYEISKLRGSINECWKTVYHQLGRNKENPLDDDIFLFNHFLIFYGKTLAESEVYGFYTRLVRGYRNNSYQDYLLEKKFTVKSLISGDLTLQELYRYVGSLKLSVEKWYEISNPRDSNLSPEVVVWLERINRIGIDECLPLIMVVLQKKYPQESMVKFLESLERLLFFILLLSRGYYYVEQMNFRELASDLNNSENDNYLERVLIPKINDSWEKISKNSETMRQISESFKGSGFYEWKGIRYFMYEYEQKIKSESKTYTDKISWEGIQADARDHKTIEHIYPQHPRSSEWTDKFSIYSSSERKILRHILGNLVPLSQPKNSSFQNKPFKEKIGNSKDSIGFKYGSFSEIELTNYSDWTAVEILDRSIRLLSFMEKRWGIQIGSHQKKIDFLNIGFVLKKEDPTDPIIQKYLKNK